MNHRVLLQKSSNWPSKHQQSDGTGERGGEQKKAMSSSFFIVPFQYLQKQIKTHLETLSSDVGKFAWPQPPVQTEEILNDLLKFTNSALQHTAVHNKWWVL